MLVPAATFTAPAWSVSGPANTGFLPDATAAWVSFARAVTSGGMLANGAMASMPLLNPPQVSVLFQVPASTSPMRLM